MLDLRGIHQRGNPRRLPYLAVMPFDLTGKHKHARAKTVAMKNRKSKVGEVRVCTVEGQKYGPLRQGFAFAAPRQPVARANSGIAAFGKPTHLAVELIWRNRHFRIGAATVRADATISQHRESDAELLPQGLPGTGLPYRTPQRLHAGAVVQQSKAGAPDRWNVPEALGDCERYLHQRLRRKRRRTGKARQQRP